MATPRKKLEGQRFNRWLVLGMVDRALWRTAGSDWLCRCDCGTERVVAGKHLTDGGSKSCGCLPLENVTKRMTRHGLAIRGQEASEYRCWVAMRDRCRRPTMAAYHRYGGRGITVCEAWGDFEVFLRDMGPRPSPLHSIDRIDNDGNYEPGNCRWATMAEQSRNKTYRKSKKKQSA